MPGLAKAITLPETLELTAEQFKRKNTVLFGESDSGKTTLMLDIMFLLKDEIDLGFIFSPTDSFEGIVARPLIHSEPDAEVLVNIMRRQEAIKEVFTKANQLPVVRRLYERVRTQQVDALLDQHKRTASAQMATIDPSSTDAVGRLEDLNKKADSKTLQIYKMGVAAGAKRLASMTLPDDERVAFQYHALKPDTLILFDDMTEYFESLMRQKNYKTLINQLFYRGRHSFITSLIGLHDDKALTTEQRKNPHITIWTCAESLRGFMRRNAAPPALKNQIEQWIAGGLFADNFKLMYVRKQSKYYRVRAQRRTTFVFGDRKVMETLSGIARTTVSNNEFVRAFL